MSDAPQVTKLLKILIAVAWLDGDFQEPEQQYLQRIAQQNGVAEDPQLRPWLEGKRPVSKEECYAWVGEYLGKNPTSESCQALLESLSGIIYSNSDVDIEEAALINQIERLNSNSNVRNNFSETVTTAIQKLYQRWIKS